MNPNTKIPSSIYELAEYESRMLAKTTLKDMKDCVGRPQIDHPERIITMLEDYGIQDSYINTIVWLHSIQGISTTPIGPIALEAYGDYAVLGARLVAHPSTSNKTTMQDIFTAETKIQLAKLAHEIDYTSPEMNDEGEEYQKIQTLRNFYIPLASDLQSDFKDRLTDNYKALLKKSLINEPFLSAILVTTPRPFILATQ